MGKYRVTGHYTIAEQVDDIEADSIAQAIEIAKQKIGRNPISAYEKVEFDVEEDFL